MKELQDSDPMPWGKYGPPPKGIGARMENVPASYFHWLWNHEDGPMLKFNKQSEVADYILRNLAALQQELPNAIW
ncbi:MAG TPA: hypothetical protein PJ991_13070 [Kiritimatiellia bacterium]|nr:hypothetical protein [Kiritimatiellia bacterium]